MHGIHGIHAGAALDTGIDNQLGGGKLKVRGSGRSPQRGKTMKKSKTLLVLALMVCLCVLLASCDGSVSSKDDDGNDAPDMVYVPQFQLMQASKAIGFTELVSYFDGDGMNANNALTASMRLPSLIGFTETDSSNALLGYTQTILGKNVSIACSKENDGSYVFEGTTVDDSIYIRTVVTPDGSVDYLEMKKIDVDWGGSSNRVIVATKGAVAIDPSKEYQIGTATCYFAGDNSGFNGMYPSQLYLSNTVTASVVDETKGYGYYGIPEFDHYYDSRMNYENAEAFIGDVSSVTERYSSDTLNLTFHLLEDNLYAQGLYIHDDKAEDCFLPTSAGQSNSFTKDWTIMQKYVSFLTDGNWTLEH